jgi:hypothetical protein
MGICLLCYQLSEWENLHIDEDHEASFEGCMECLPHLSAREIKHLPYYLGDLSYPTI